MLNASNFSLANFTLGAYILRPLFPHNVTEVYPQYWMTRSSGCLDIWLSANSKQHMEVSLHFFVQLSSKTDWGQPPKTYVHSNS